MFVIEHMVSIVYSLNYTDKDATLVNMNIFHADSHRNPVGWRADNSGRRRRSLAMFRPCAFTPTPSLQVSRTYFVSKVRSKIKSVQ